MTTLSIGSRRCGKANAQRMEINAALRRGEVVALCSIGPDGRSRVCTVYPLHVRRA